jgi:hypothetical protein
LLRSIRTLLLWTYLAASAAWCSFCLAKLVYLRCFLPPNLTEIPGKIGPVEHARMEFVFVRYYEFHRYGPVALLFLAAAVYLVVMSLGRNRKLSDTVLTVPVVTWGGLAYSTLAIAGPAAMWHTVETTYPGPISEQEMIGFALCFIAYGAIGGVVVRSVWPR